MIEHFFNCPYCWEKISMVLDADDEMPEYIEDCEVCCRPIEIRFRIIEGVLISFSAEKMEGI